MSRRFRHGVTATALSAFLVGAGCSTAAKQFEMPNLIGSYWVDAEPRLRSVGWTGMLNYAGDVPSGAAIHNRIVSQDPAAGTTTNTDVGITLKFGA